MPRRFARTSDWILSAAICAGSMAVHAAEPPQRVTVEQLNAVLAEKPGKTDAGLAGELGNLELTERVSGRRLSQWMAALPGEQSKEALTILADSAEWLRPQTDAVVANPVPDAATLGDMLVRAVQYANTTLHKLPDFLATRDTEAFEDRPTYDWLESTGTVSFSASRMHLAGRAAAEVTYRNGQEEQRASRSEGKHSEGGRGLATAGEFGPFLTTVLSDALKGRVTWDRWEQGGDGIEAVFDFHVPRNLSHYEVVFCCVNEDPRKPFAIPQFYRQVAAYHGEVAYDPAAGVVRRVAIVAEQGRDEMVQDAAMMVEYGPVLIAGKTVILPTRSVSLLGAHTSPPMDGMHTARKWLGPVKTFLNDTEFVNYHQFRGDVRMVNDGVSGP